MTTQNQAVLDALRQSKAQIKVMAIDCDNAATDGALLIIEQAIAAYDNAKGEKK